MDYAFGPTPNVGMTVSTLTRKGTLIYGEIVAERYDGKVSFFTVEWPGLSVEYPTNAWGDSVYVPTCPECDSPNHADGNCRSHFA